MAPWQEFLECVVETLQNLQVTDINNCNMIVFSGIVQNKIWKFCVWISL
jgi:hypothetical protein